MADEGTLHTIEIKGIERNGSYALAESGECNEVIGLELKNGCLVPFEPIKTAADMSDFDNVWVHKTSKQNNYIYLKEREIYWQSEDAALCGELSLTHIATLPAGCKRIDFVNNILCYCRTIHLFKDGAYSSAASIDNIGFEMIVGTIGNGIALMVDKYTSGEGIDGADYKYDNLINHTKGIDYRQRITDNFKILSAGVRRGEYINGACLMRYAVRLYDGSYVNISEPVFVTSDPHKVLRPDGTTDDLASSNTSRLAARPTGEAKFIGQDFSFPSNVQEQLLKSAFWWEQLPFWEFKPLAGQGSTQKYSEIVKKILGDYETGIKEREKKPMAKYKVEVFEGKAPVDIMRNHRYAARYQKPSYNYWLVSNSQVAFREVFQFNSDKFEPKEYYKYDTASKKLTYDYQETESKKSLSEVNQVCDITWDSFSAEVAPLIANDLGYKLNEIGFKAWVDDMIANIYQNRQADDIGTQIRKVNYVDGSKPHIVYNGIGSKTNNRNWFVKNNMQTSNMHHGELGVAAWNLNELDGNSGNHKVNIYTVLSRECDTPAFIIKSKIPELMSSLVSSVDIFMTEIVDCHEDYANDNIGTMASHRPYKRADDIAAELSKLAGTFYKIHSITKEELEAIDLDKLVIPYIDRGKISQLEQQPTLTEYGQDKYDYGVSYMYNNKLHIAQIRQIISNGFENYAGNIGAYGQLQQRIGENLATHTHSSKRYDIINKMLDTKKAQYKRSEDCTYALVGTVTIDDETMNVNETVSWRRNIDLNKFRLALSSFVYPSASATSFSIYCLEVTDKTDGSTHYYKIDRNYQLTQDKNTLISYYMGEPIYLDTQSLVEIQADEAISAFAKMKVGEETIVERDGNLFKVSKTNNPIVFPYEQTYTVGFGKIIGFSSNAVAVSQGQFGTYPLYVFTTEGIFAMQVDTSGVGSYLSNAPLSREVCNNPNSIVQTEAGIYFSTDKGLMLLSGSTTALVSENINGTPEPLPNTSDTYERGDGLKVYGNAITNVQLVQLSGAISYSDFRVYVSDKDTHCSYIYVKSKLIVYNPNYNYCYLIDIETNVCTKLNKRIKFDTKNYPLSLYAVFADTSCNLYEFPFDGDSAGNDVLLQTRPIKLSSDDLKGTFRVVLRGLFVGTPDKYSGLYVSGSIDGKRWMYLGGTERKHIANIPVRDIGTTIERNSCRFLTITFVGNLLPESKIEYFDITSSNRYGDKPK